MKHSASTTRADSVSTNLSAKKYMKIGCVLKNKPAHLKNVHSDTPKHADIFYKEEICRFGEDCSYAHKKVMNKDMKFEEMKDKHENEINDIKDEMDKLKETISLMQNKITELNQEIQSSKTINISEIVGLVVSLLDNTKTSEKSSNTANTNESLMQCAICAFKSENEEQRICHMREEHEDCFCCYLCDKYFETKQSMKYHNEFIHN